MCEEFCWGGFAPVHAGIAANPREQAGTPRDQAGNTPVPGRHPPGSRQAPPPPQDEAGIPRDQPPREHGMLGDRVNERAVCIVLRCNFVVAIEKSVLSATPCRHPLAQTFRFIVEF